MKFVNIFLVLLLLSFIDLKKTRKLKGQQESNEDKKNEAGSDEEGDKEGSSGGGEEESSESSDEDQETEELNVCNNELLYSFGVLNSGYRNEKSILCQNAVKESCCSKTSEKLIMNFWKNNNKIRIKQYLEGYTWLFKSIMNYYENVIDLAKIVKTYPSSTPHCSKIAKSLIDRYIQKQSIQDFVIEFNKFYQHLAFVRKSFYCVLCTIDTQNFFKVQEKSIVYAKKFCENLVESSIEINFKRSKQYLRLFNEFNQIIDCDPNKGQEEDVYQISFDLKKDDDKALSKCYQTYSQDQDSRVYIPECIDYCKKFSISAAREMFEGHFGKMNYLHTKIKNKFEEPQKPIFSEIDNDLNFDFSHIGDTFFESNLNGFNLQDYTAEFENNGIELFFISAKSNLKYQNDPNVDIKMNQNSIASQNILLSSIVFFIYFICLQLIQLNVLTTN